MSARSITEAASTDVWTPEAPTIVSATQASVYTSMAGLVLVSNAQVSQKPSITDWWLTLAWTSGLCHHNPKADYFQSWYRTPTSALHMRRNESTICCHTSWMFSTVLYCAALIEVCLGQWAVRFSRVSFHVPHLFLSQLWFWWWKTNTSFWVNTLPYIMSKADSSSSSLDYVATILVRFRQCHTWSYDSTSDVPERGLNAILKNPKGFLTHVDIITKNLPPSLRYLLMEDFYDILKS